MYWLFTHLDVPRSCSPKLLAPKSTYCLFTQFDVVLITAELLLTHADAPRTASPLRATQLDVACSDAAFAATQFDVVLNVGHCALIKFEFA